MARTSELRQFLDNLHVKDLQSVRREFATRVTPYDDICDKTEFAGRLRYSIQRSIDSKMFSFGDVVSFVIDDVRNGESRWATSLIRDTLSGMEFSKFVKYQDAAAAREKWMCGEIFQALRTNMKEKAYRVSLEERFGGQRIDVLVSHKKKNLNYPIEVKRSKNGGSMARLSHQLEEYRHNVPYCQKIFALIVAEGEKWLPSEQTRVRRVVSSAKRRKDVEVIVKGPDEIRG